MRSAPNLITLVTFVKATQLNLISLCPSKRFAEKEFFLNKINKVIRLIVCVGHLYLGNKVSATQAQSPDFKFGMLYQK